MLYCFISKPLHFGLLERREQGSVLTENDLVNLNPCEISLVSVCHGNWKDTILWENCLHWLVFGKMISMLLIIYLGEKSDMLSKKKKFIRGSSYTPFEELGNLLPAN